YPGVTGGAGAQRRTVQVSGPTQPVVTPAGGTPAAITTVPGLGALGAALGGASVEIPGQFARFDSRPLDTAVEVVGAPTVDLAVPQVPGRAQAEAGSARWWVLLGAVVLLGLLAWATALLWGRRRRRRISAVDPDGEAVPLRFQGVTKAYKDKFVAVRDLSFE